MTAVQLGAANREDGTSLSNSIEFTIRQILAGMATVKIVEVISVSGATLSIRILVNQVDGLGNATSHGVINGVRYMQLQSGPSAITMPPVAGDIGIAVFADQDSSSVIKNAGQANPGSLRRFDPADAIYVTGIGGLNETPTQYINFLSGAGGINIVTPGPLAITASGVTHNGVNIGNTHKHLVSNVATGTANIETGVPNE